MRFIVALAAALVTAPAVFSDETKEPESVRLLAGLEKSPRQFLLPLGAINFRDVKPAIPMISVGSVANAREFMRRGAGNEFPAWYNKNLDWANREHPLVRVIAAETSLEPARSRSPTCLVLYGPDMNSGEGFGPVLVTRDGNTITLLAESWFDNAGRDKNLPGRQAYLLLLGNLDAGEYTLRFVWRGLFKDAGKGELLYGINSLRFGQTKFTVYKEDDRQARPGTLAERDLQTVAIPKAQKTRRWQVPWHVSRSLDLGGNMNALPGVGLRVGSLDLNQWLLKNQGTHAEMPVLGRVEATSTVSATLLGPSMNLGERMTLRAIEWQGKNAVLKVDVWRDNGPRKKNIPYMPLLVVPLQPLAKLEAREYRVRVDWSFLRAPNILGTYKPEETPKGIEEKSRQTFTVR